MNGMHHGKKKSAFWKDVKEDLLTDVFTWIMSFLLHLMKNREKHRGPGEKQSR